MKKANAEQITNENLYKGLSLAYTGGNIGMPSNDITKIWNNGKITDESLTVVKWLVAQVNYTIDYAKTLYKPNPPEHVIETIKSYSKSKVPYFFVYAKGKTLGKTENINNSTVNRISTIFPKRNLKFNFLQSNLGKFNYRVLLNNPDAVSNSEIYSHYKQLVKNLDFDRNDDKLNPDDETMFNYFPVYDECRSNFYKWGDERGISRYDMLDSLIVSLFGENTVYRKKAFWTLFGDDIYNNVSHNIKSSFVQCERCKKRFMRINKKQICCEKCEVHLNKKGLKIYRCASCGKVIEIPKTSTIATRCKSCAKERVAHMKVLWQQSNT